MEARSNPDLVVAVEIGDLDFEPEQTALAERFFAREGEQSAAEVVSQMVQMGRDRVHAASKIEIHREVDRLRLIAARSDLRRFETPARCPVCSPGRSAASADRSSSA